MPIRHPSNAKLLRWLETGETGKVHDHVESCERCADRLIVLDGDHVANIDAPEQRARRERLAELLSSMYSTPEGLTERVVESVERRSKGERELALFAGLMAVGFDTARLVASGSLAAADHGDSDSHRYPQPEGGGVSDRSGAEQDASSRDANSRDATREDPS